MSAIHLENIHFGYKKNEEVLSDINLNVPEGSIYGFLGANGAGKTTSIRLILGLLKPLKGQISIFGKDIRATYPKHLKQVGSLIENPSLYGHLSAMDNLRIWAKYFEVDSKRIHEVLDLMDLTKAKKKKTSDFSTGMKQRLGLATALLHDPQLLILDEPTNGLDPLGIIDLRGVLHTLQAAGKTILLSSHILPEVEKLVNRIGILQNGKVVFEGKMEELQALRRQNISVTLKVSQPQEALQWIPVLQKNLQENQSIRMVLEHESELPQIIRLLVDNGIDIYAVIPNAGNLEELFLSLTHENEPQK